MSCGDMPAMEAEDMTRLRLGYQAFVRAENQDTAAIKEAEDSEGEEAGREHGESARLFYEETINNDKYTKKRTLIRKGKCETVELSDSSEEEIEIIDCKANKDLLTAIQNNNLQMVKNIKNCDYNCRDEHGWTPLEIAAVLGHEDIVRKTSKFWNFSKRRV